MEPARECLRKLSLILAALLALVTPAYSQSQLLVSSTTVTLTDNQARSIQVTTAGVPPVSYTVSGVPSWFRATSLNNFTTPDTLFFQLANTNCGTCTATITLIDAGGVSTPVTVTVTYRAGSTGPATLTASPSSLTFSAPPGQSAGSQNVTLSTAGPGGVVITGIGSDQTWLSGSITSGSFSITPTNPATLTVAATAANLSNATYVGHLTITPSIGAATTVTVILNVGTGGGTVIVATPASLNFTAPSGQFSPTQYVSLTTASSTPVQILGITPDVSWLSVVLTSGSFTISSANPATLSVTASAANLPNGTYIGHITLLPNGGPSTVITATFNVGAAGTTGTITASQTSFQFSYPGNTLLAPITIGTSNSAVTCFNVFTSSQSNWLLFQGVSGPYNGLPFGTYTISVNTAVAATLATGTYGGNVTLINPLNLNDITNISITLTVNGGSAPALTVNPSSLTFTLPVGASPQSQTLVVTPAGNATVQANISSFNGSFFNVSSPSCTGTPNPSFTCVFSGTQPLTVTVNPGNLAIGTYTGSLVFQSGGSTVTVPLTLNVTAPVTTLSAAPTSLTFTAAAGSAPQTQMVAVSAPANAPVQLTLSTFNGNFFFVLAPNCAANPLNTPTCTFTGSQTLNVTVNPSILTVPGSYNGSILLQSGGVSVVITVSLTLTSGGSGGTATLVAPPALSFSYQTGSGVLAPQQTVAIGPVGTFSATANVNGSTSSWLAVSTVGAVGPGFAIVTVTPQGLAPGTYSGTVVINSSMGTFPVPVTLNVYTGKVVVANPGDVFLNYQAGGSPVFQTITLNSSDSAPTPVSATTSTPWITIQSQSANTTPALVQLSLNPAGLCNGLNNGSVQVSAPNAANSAFSIPVVVEVSGSTTCPGGASGPLMLGATLLSFTAQSNGPVPQSQTLTVVAPSSSTSYTVTYAINGATPNWLTVQPSGTLFGNQTLIVSANPNGLGVGTYSGTITFNTNGSIQTVQVTFVVTPSISGLIATPASLTFTAASGQSAGSQNVTLSTSSATPITILGVSTDSPNFLSASISGSFTVTSANPATLTVTATAARLPVGPFIGHVTVNSSAGVTTVTVTINVTSGSVTGTIVASPATLTFFGPAGQVTSPQTVTLTTGTAIAVVGITTDVNWLTLSTSSLTVSSVVPSTFTVTANAATLAGGFYVGHITLTPTLGTNTVIAVTFLVQPPSSGGTITANPASLAFVYPSGGTSALVAIGTNNPALTTFNVVVTSQNNWMLFGNSPTGTYTGLQFGSYLVRVNPNIVPTLAAGVYSGTLTLINPLNAGDITNVPLSLTVNGGMNLSQGKVATESSTYPGSPSAGAAVDGSTDGNYFDGSVTATNLETNPWWQVDLGASVGVNSMVIWNRTDCCSSRLSDYWVFLSDTPFLPSDTPASLQFRPGTFSIHQTSAPSPNAGIPLAGQGRYVRVQLSGTDILSLSEVQVFGVSAPLLSDLALGKTATQSSNFPGAPTAGASSANDGNTDGNFYDGSVTATNLEPTPWWQVDLGASSTIGSIVVWNRTDCCSSRLSDYWVFVSDTPFLPTDTPATLQSRAGTFARHQTGVPSPSSLIAPVGQGRYVRVQLSDAGYLSLAEVQVFGVPVPANPNLALGKSATQSSTFPGAPTAVASAAVDGNTDGNFFDGSVTATDLQTNPWWQVDLGASATVNSVAVWNRTDCCSTRLGDYWIFISDTPFLATDTPATLQFRSGTFAVHQTAVPSPSAMIPTGARGRYVRIQLSGTDYLSLAEVQVFGQ